MTNSRNHTVKNGHIGSRKGGKTKDSKRPISIRSNTAPVSNPFESALIESRSARQHENILKSRHEKTDDLIECLHKSLIEQLNSKPAEGKSAVLNGSISGAVAHKIGPRRDIGHDHVRPTVRERKKRECAHIAQLVSNTQELVSLAEELGIDMTATSKNLAHAKAALGRDEPTVARDWSANADWRVKDELLLKLPSVVRRTSASLRELESECGTETNLKRIIADSKQALKVEDYQKSLRLLNGVKNSIQKAQSTVVLRIIADAKGDFQKARKAGLNINEAVDLLNVSREKLRRGEFAEAVKCARESRTVAQRSIDNQRDAKHPLMECIKAIRLAETLGADVKGLNELLAEARRLYKHNDMVRSAERSRKLLDLARRTAYDKAAESYQMAERAVALAKRTAIEAPEAEEKLAAARELLEKDDLAKSFSMSCSCIFESDASIANALTFRLKNIDEFAKGIERDVDSLTEVQDGIESSKQRNMENLKKYADQTDRIIGEAYECAAAYARVAQDIVKQAYENSIEAGEIKDIVSRSTDRLELPGEISSIERRPFSEKRQRLVDMFLTGKVSEGQLDKLLLMIDSSVEKDNLV